MTHLKIPIHVAEYDRRHDVLHVHFAGACRVSDEEESPGIYVRRSMVDDTIVGITVMDFSVRRGSAQERLGFVDWQAVAIKIAQAD